MRDRREQMKKEDKNHKYLLMGGIVILSFLIILAVFGKKGVFQLKDMRHKKTVVQAEIDRLEEENTGLKEKIGALKSDKKEVEKLARSELGLVKEGEVVYQFVGEKE